MHVRESDSANEARPRPSRARVAFGACLVMHVFMHRGHGKGGGHGH